MGVFAAVGQALADFDSVSSSFRQLDVGEKPPISFNPDVPRNRASDHLASPTCEVSKITDQDLSFQSAGEKCWLHFSSAIGNKSLKTSNTGFTKQWPYRADYKVSGDYSGTFAVETFTSKGTVSNGVTRKGLSEYTANAQGNFSGQGFSLEHGSFSTQRSGRFVASRKATAWDSEGNPTAFEQSQNIRNVLSMTSKLVNKTVTIATETKVNNIGEREVAVYLNGKKMEDDHEYYFTLVNIFKDLESPLVIPDLPIY